MTSVKQTKPFLVISNGEKVHCVVTRPGSETFYSEAIYEHAEGDTLSEALGEKPVPSVEEYRRLFIDKDDETINSERSTLLAAK